jgi:predicted 2-oxoglutarate/Fe(II)-dependent dioxygenase YbiX
MTDAQTAAGAPRAPAKPLPPPPFGVGDRMPAFKLPDASGAIRDFSAEVTGRPALLLLAERLADGPGATLWSLLAAQAPRLAEAGVELFAISGDSQAALADLDPPAGIATLAVREPDRKLSQMLLAGQPVRLLALDANQRVLAAPGGADPLAQLEAALAAVSAWRLGVGEATPAGIGAPVLVLPRVIPPELCGQLIRLWETQNQEGRVSAGSNENFYSADRKKNREHVVSDPAIAQQVLRYVTRRIGPELAKVFNYTQPYRFESFIVLGYQVERKDFFGRHRDRYLPEHPRRFAMSLNLNDDYDGGWLRFPEYSNQLYRPPAGGACIFSCLLLHEALPVTRGRRFAMTTFFHAADAPPQRPIQR